MKKIFRRMMHPASCILHQIHIHTSLATTMVRWTTVMLLLVVVVVLCHFITTSSSSHICHGFRWVVVIPHSCCGRHYHHHRPYIPFTTNKVRFDATTSPDNENPDWDGIGASQFDNDIVIPAAAAAASNGNDDHSKNNNSSIDNPNDDDNNNKDQERANPRKFGGRSSSSSLFASSSIQNSNNNNNNNFEVDERDYQLVSVFERTLPIQVAMIVAIFGLVGFIGLSGGITDGSDRFPYNDDVDTTTITTPSNDPTSPPIIVGPSVFL